MADSLDDFFAKKDKKRKNKSQASALSAEALVRELGEGSSKHNEYLSRREGKTSAALELLGLDANDNDWKDFEEVEKRDYTGLKVKEMSIQDQEEEQRRHNEQAEQVPETIPWKSKEETVAAIISTKDPFASDLLRDAMQEEVEEEGPESEAQDQVDSENQATNTEADESTPSDKTECDPVKSAVSSSTTQEQKQDEATAKAATVKTLTPQAGTPTASGPAATAAAIAAAAPKKEGDSGSKPSAKYVPPHERLNSDVKLLEPVRLGKVVSSGRSLGGGRQTIDIQDEKAFPSLG